MSSREAHDFIARSIAESVDTDPDETREWLEALEASVREGGSDRGLFLLERLEERAQGLGIVPHVQPFSAYRNTIPVDAQPPYPGDIAVEVDADAADCTIVIADTGPGIPPEVRGRLSAGSSG